LGRPDQTADGPSPILGREMQARAAANKEIIGINATCSLVNAYDLAVINIMVALRKAVEAEQILKILKYNKVATEITSSDVEPVVRVDYQFGDEFQVSEQLIDARSI